MERWLGVDRARESLRGSAGTGRTSARTSGAGHAGSAVTIGVFDGVHQGHRVVISRAVAQARQAGIPSVVVTFDPHPLYVLRPEAAPARLSTLQHRLELLEGLGVDATLVVAFTRELAARSPEDFVADVLLDALAARHVVVGQDFRFGRRASGDVELLRRLGAAHGFVVDAVPPVQAPDAEVRWSSTWVRERVAAGDVAAAARALARPHRLEGTVVAGDRRGRTIGYPTANLSCDPGSAVPADGVYAGWLVHARVPKAAAISIGTNPTFGGSQRRIEAYVLDETGLQLYGEHVALDFAARLRPTLRFDTVDALLAQMAADVARTRGVLGAPAPSAGSA